MKISGFQTVFGASCLLCLIYARVTTGGNLLLPPAWNPLAEWVLWWFVLDLAAWLVAIGLWNQIVDRGASSASGVGAAVIVAVLLCFAYSLDPDNPEKVVRMILPLPISIAVVSLSGLSFYLRRRLHRAYISGIVPATVALAGVSLALGVVAYFGKHSSDFVLQLFLLVLLFAGPSVALQVASEAARGWMLRLLLRICSFGILAGVAFSAWIRSV
jgi:hypothetical protein